MRPDSLQHRTHLRTAARAGTSRREETSAAAVTLAQQRAAEPLPARESGRQCSAPTARHSVSCPQHSSCPAGWPGCSAAFLLERRRNRRRSSEQHPNGDPQADDREDAHRPGAPMPLPRMPGGPPRPRKPPAKPSPPGAPAQGAPTGSPSQPPIGGGPKPPAGSHGSAPAGPPYGPPGGPHVAACARAAAARARASSSLRTRSKFAKYISSWICAPRGRAHRPTMCIIIP